MDLSVLLGNLTTVEWVIIIGGLWLVFNSKSGEEGENILTRIVNLLTGKNSPTKFNLSAPVNMADFVRLIEPHQKLLAKNDEGSATVAKLIDCIATEFADKAKQGIQT